MDKQNILDTLSITKQSIKFENTIKQSDFELLNVFDSEYNNIGTTTRYLCHRLGLYHEVINCFIQDDDGNLLLQNRKDKLVETFDVSIGGHISVNDENPLGALKRESMEELNLVLKEKKVEKIALYKRFGYTNILKPRETNNEFRHLFCYKIDNNEKEKLNKNFTLRKNSEAESFIWISIKDTIDLISSGKAFDGLQFSMYYLLNWIKENNK